MASYQIVIDDTAAQDGAEHASLDEAVAAATAASEGDGRNRSIWVSHVVKHVVAAPVQKFAVTVEDVQDA